MSLSVIQRVLLGFGVLLCLLVMTATSGLLGLTKVEDRLHIVTEHVAKISSTSHILKEDLSLANSAVLQYLLSKSPDSLENLSLRFEGFKKGFLSTSSELGALLQQHQGMESSLSKINSEVRNYFHYTDQAFSNHKDMLTMQAAVVTEKVDLKDSVIFLLEDLTMLRDDTDNLDVKYSADYMINRVQSIQVSVIDYFDLRELDDLDSLRDTMSSSMARLKEKQLHLNDSNIDGLVEEVEAGLFSADGVLAKQYESIRLGFEAEVLAKRLLNNMNVVNEHVEALLLDAKSMSESAKVEASDAASLSSFVITLVLVISIVIAVVVALWVSRSIRLPLKEVMRVLGNIADGDFTQRSHVKTKDEFGELSNWVNSLVSKLQSVMAEIEKVSAEVSESAGGNVRIAGDSKSIMSAQNERTTEVASSMTEMAATVAQVAQSSETILHQIHGVDQRASQNRQQMDANIAQIEQLLTQIEGSTEVVNELDEHSKNIDNILDVIQEIAEQTNLLALNAAIEAARAGEQGRGFAVVADEVRTLATRTHRSTEEIQNVIVQLQQGVTKTVHSMELSQKSANASVKEAQSVGSSLTELQSSMTEIRDLSTQIATAAEEQSATAQEIRQNIIDISEMSEEAASGADKSEKSGEGLSKLASHQKHLISQFKIV